MNLDLRDHDLSPDAYEEQRRQSQRRVTIGTADEARSIPRHTGQRLGGEGADGRPMHATSRCET